VWWSRAGVRGMDRAGSQRGRARGAGCAGWGRRKKQQARRGVPYARAIRR